MNRRTLLKRGLFGGALLTFGGAAYLGLRGGTRGPTPSRPLLVIGESTFPILVALMARMVGAPGVDWVAVAHTFDERLSHTNPAIGRDINRVLGLLENSLSGLLLRNSATHFTSLDEAGQDAAIMSWQGSRLTLLRSASASLKKLSVAAFYADAGNAKSIGYPGAPFLKPALPITPRGALAPKWVSSKTEEVPE